MDKKTIKTNKGLISAQDHVIKSIKTGKVPDESGDKRHERAVAPSCSADYPVNRPNLRSSSIVAVTTTKANATMPPLSQCAAAHSPRSTKS